jgi:hypothetical protein
MKRQRAVFFWIFYTPPSRCLTTVALSHHSNLDWTLTVDSFNLCQCSLRFIGRDHKLFRTFIGTQRKSTSPRISVSADHGHPLRLESTRMRRSERAKRYLFPSEIARNEFGALPPTNSISDVTPYDEARGVTSPVSKGHFRPTAVLSRRMYSIKVAGNKEEKEFQIPIHSFRSFPRGPRKRN